MKHWIFMMVICIAGNSLLAQEKQEKIETDRPGETQIPALVPTHYFQAELGFMKENSGDDYMLYYPDFLLRYGVSKKFELRVEGDWVSEYRQLIPNPKTTAGLQPVELGGKLSLLEEKGLVPNTALLAQVGLPFLSSKAFRTPHLIPSFRLAMQNSLTQKSELGYNIGAEWDGESGTPSWLYAISPGFDIGEKAHAFIEAYGYLQAHQLPQHTLDAGFMYDLSSNMRADLSAGVGLSKSSPDQFIAVGFSFRVPTSKKAAH